MVNEEITEFFVPDLAEEILKYCVGDNKAFVYDDDLNPPRLWEDTKDVEEKVRREDPPVKLTRTQKRRARRQKAKQYSS
jgi:hypothetical protein